VIDDGRARVWVLAFVVAAASGFGILVGVGCALRANACPFTKGKVVTTTDGRQLYGMDCAVCHGLNGEGGRGPSLTRGEAAKFSEVELGKKISQGRPFYGMPAFKRSLSETQISAIARYIISLRGSS
jgi:mono/diheme cytochrome c family protein